MSALLAVVALRSSTATSNESGVLLRQIAAVQILVLFDRSEPFEDGCGPR
jgi:hypothetical protein